MTSVLTFWRAHPKLTPFSINAGVGVLIAVLFAFTATSQWGEGLTNAAFDLLVKYEHDSATASPGAETSLFFVEITPEEYLRWGEPLLTPRDRVADLIEAAWHKGAPVVALDILLDRPDYQHPAGDRKLHRLLERMLRENSRTQVIFPVRIGGDGVLRSTICDDLLDRTTADGRHILHRSVPNVLASEGDLQNRFWDMYQVARDRGGKLQVIWSVPVLAAALHGVGASGGDQGAAELDRAAEELLAGAGAEHAGAGGHGAPHLRLAGKELHLPVLERVTEPGARQERFGAGESHSLPYTQRIRFLVGPGFKDRRDAGKFRTGLSPDSLAGKIVVIGNGSPDTGDVVPTPVGPMAGMYVIGNAINTIVSGRMPVHMPAWEHYAIEALVIVIAAGVFLYFQGLAAQLLTSVILISVLVPFSWVLYRDGGLFFNFIVPVAGMRLHKTFASLEEMVTSRSILQQHHHTHD